jgi:hypothetical protein
MRTLSIVILCIAMLAGLTAMASAQGDLKQEVSVSGGWMNLSAGGTDISTTFLVGQYGKFLQPNLELTVGLAYVNLDVGGSVSAFALNPGVQYYWSQNPDALWVPYVGVGFYYASVSGGGWSDNNTNFSYVLGVKNFFGKTMDEAEKAFFVEYRGYNKILGEVNVNGILVGISNYF